MSRCSGLAVGSFVVLLLANSGPATAFVAKRSLGRSDLPGEVVIRPDLSVARDLGATAALGTAVETLVDRHSGATRLISATSFHSVQSLAATASPAEFLAACHTAAGAALGVLGLESTSDLALVESSQLFDKDVQFLDFDVQRDGLRVADANVAFRFKQGKLIQMQTLTFAEAASDRRAEHPELDRLVAAALASVEVTRLDQQLYRAVPAKAGYRLVRVVQYVASADGELYDVQAVAATGEIFQAVARHRYAAGEATARVYPRTWYQGALVEEPLSEARLTVGNASVTTGVDGTFNATTTPRLNGFKGTRADVRVSTGTLVQKDAVLSNGAYALNVTDEAEKSLSQAMTFHHLNTIVQKAKQYITAGWLDRALVANVNLGQTCNAFWNGTTVNFYSAGGGCANTALISDVVYHEWGHGLDANTGGIADGAYSEGFGDIVAMIMTRSADMAPGFRTSGGSIRNLEPNKIYPRDRGEVHAEGLIIGGTFWDLYKALDERFDAVEAMDKVADYAFKTIFTARRYTDVYNALLVVDDDDGNLSNKTPNFCAINGAFAAHGLATADASCR